MNNEYQLQNLISKFKVYQMHMKDIWQDYNYLQQTIKSTKLRDMEIESLFNHTKKLKRARNLSGRKSSFLSYNNGKSHFIDAIITFEQFIYYLSKENFKHFPKKLGKEPMHAKKLMTLIYDQEDANTIIERIIEEKNRGIFYGNPIDIFTKDPCKFQVKNFFKDNYTQELTLFSEVIARRNIVIHNDSRVDSKYIKETKRTDIVNGQKMIINSDYLKGTIILLLGLSAELLSVYLKNNYNYEASPLSILGKTKRKFKRASNSSSLDEWLK